MWIFQKGVLNLTLNMEKSFSSRFDVSFCIIGVGRSRFAAVL